MSELEQIAADANITIVDSGPNEGGDTVQQDVMPDNSCPTIPQIVDASGDPGVVQALEAEFSHRYSDQDSDYMKTVSEAAVWARPPCVKNFFVKSRNWRGRGRGRGGNWGDRGGYRDRSNDRNRHDNNHRGWGGGEYRERDNYQQRGYQHNQGGGYRRDRW